MKTIIFIFGILLLVSWTKEVNVKIKIESQSEIKDSIIIRDLITGGRIFTFSSDNEEIEFNLMEPTVVSIESMNNPQRFPQLGILYNGKITKLRVSPNNILTSNNVADSLLQYLFSSNNLFIQKNQNDIFGSNNAHMVFSLFSHFLNERDSVLDNHKNELTSIESGILHFQNHARIYSFLFYYGRMNLNLAPEDTFWEFTKDIDNDSSYNKSLPDNVLYKYEIEYLKKHKEIESITGFLNYIEENTTNTDLAEYLKAIYIKELISNPDYWLRHINLFDSVVLNAVLKNEENNPYKDIFIKTTQNHVASQQGMPAYNFSGIDLDNKPIKLSDFSGKYILIDVWATWCGGCINQKPLFSELASKFRDYDDIQFVSISVDSSIESWRNYLAKNNKPSNVIELNIKNGMKTEFGAEYSINFIPKYILINKEGKIIDANIQKPSTELEIILNKELSQE